MQMPSTKPLSAAQQRESGNRKARRKQLAELKATKKFTSQELGYIKEILKK
jgi:hypothetical protein